MLCTDSDIPPKGIKVHMNDTYAWTVQIQTYAYHICMHCTDADIPPQDQVDSGMRYQLLL